jgi:hypothetical protein
MPFSFLLIVVTFVLLVSVKPTFGFSTPIENSKNFNRRLACGCSITSLLSSKISNEEIQKLCGRQFSIDQQSQPLLDWLFQEQDCQGEGSIQILRQEVVDQRSPKVKPIFRRGLYAVEDCPAGDYIFAIPLQSALIIEEDESNDAERGLKLLSLQEENKKSKWACYFEALPTKDDQFDPTPDFWSDEQIQQLESPRLIQNVLARKQRIRDLSKQQNIPLDDLQFATWLVESRSLTLLRELEGQSDEEDESLNDAFETTSVIIPIVDMINHSSDRPNAELDVLFYEDSMEENGDGEIQVVVGADGSGDAFYAVVATEDIPAGTEIKISYGTGEDSSIELIQNYGFVPPDNSFDDPSIGTDDDSCFLPESSWSSTLEEDEIALRNAAGVDRTILQFRMRMKRAIISS